MLLIGCIARRTRLTDFGVTARLTARPGCTARRTARGTNMREKNPMAGMFVANPRLVNATVRITARRTGPPACQTTKAPRDNSATAIAAG